MLHLEIPAIVTTTAGCSAICRPYSNPLQRSGHDNVHAPSLVCSR
jgi:hypothetical protein